MSDNVIQTSFSAGELSPNLNARVDFAKYRSGCATMRNFFVDYRSGASTRPGTEFIRPTQSEFSRLVRFQQSTTVTYVLEFGHGYIRFVTQGSSVVEVQSDIVDITRSGIARVDIGDTTGYIDFDMVFITDATGMPQINNRYFIISNITATTMDLTDAYTESVVDSTSYGVYTGGGAMKRVYTIATPYEGQDLALLKFSQNASVMNITHPLYPPYTLTLIDATNWVLEPVVFGASVEPPPSISVTSTGTGPVTYKYVVTSVDDNEQESPPSAVGSVSSTLDLRLDPGTNTVTWSPATGAVAYNVYGSSPSYAGLGGGVSGVGFMGVTYDNQFQDSNIAPDFSQTPPVHENPFAGVNPAVSSYFQQRLVYANGGGDLVQTFWASRVGASYNFDTSTPPQANDAITAELVSLEVNEIKSMVPMPTGLIMLTTNGAWQVNGGAGGVATQGGPITPITATATPQAYIGANDVPPIVVNFDILFVQAKGSIVRDLTFNLYQNIYTGNDISILSSHLFYGHTIHEWSYAEEPFKTIWCVREDGILLSLTLVKEQDMYGWARHDTRGNFKSVASVTEGQVDATYVVVERPNPLGGIDRVKAIERFANREFPFGAEDAWCSDCGVKTVSNFPNGILKVSAATGTVQLVCSTSVFLGSTVGSVIRIGGGIINVTAVQDEFVATGLVVQEITNIIPNDPEKRPDDALPGTWSLDKPGTVLYGLDHLEGQQVSVLADGGVVNGLVVENGSITLPNPATKVIVGLAFQAQLQTMPLDLGNEVNTVQGKRKKVSALTVRVKDSRAVKTGMTFGTVTPIKELNRVTQMGFPIKLITADERIIMDPLWDVPGQICIQVDDPLPTTVLGVIPEVVVGDGQK